MYCNHKITYKRKAKQSKAKQSKMSSIIRNNNLSLFIPHVFENIDEERIRKIFKYNDYGEVGHVDFVNKIDQRGVTYNSAYVHFKTWFNNKHTANFQEKVIDTDKEARIVYDDPWYWIVLENKASKHVPGSRKPTLDLRETVTQDDKKEKEEEHSEDLVDSSYAFMLEHQIELLRTELNVAYTNLGETIDKNQEDDAIIQSLHYDINTLSCNQEQFQTTFQQVQMENQFLRNQLLFYQQQQQMFPPQMFPPQMFPQQTQIDSQMEW